MKSWLLVVGLMVLSAILISDYSVVDSLRSVVKDVKDKKEIDLGVLRIEIGRFVAGEGSVEDLGKQCEVGDAASCFNLALAHERGDEVLKDPAKVQELIERGCSLDIINCAVLARMDAESGDLDRFPRALQLFERSCNAGYTQACSDLGMMYHV